jgi:hypothetical protein
MMPKKKPKTRAPKVTSPRVARIASKQLRTTRVSRAAKSTAGSALAQKE